MKEIVKVLLQEGINEETIHEVLDVLEGHNLVKTVFRAREKGNISHEKMNDLLGKASRIKGTNDYYKKDGEERYSETGDAKKGLSKRDKGDEDNLYRTAVKTNRDSYRMHKRQEQDAKNNYEIATDKSIDRNRKKNDR